MQKHSMFRKNSKTSALQPNCIGDISEELEVPQISEVIFRKCWHIRNYEKAIRQYEVIDSPPFKCAVNGLTTTWNMAIRFWKSSKYKKMRNPIAMCLNLVACEVGETEQGQAYIRFQFGVWDAVIKHWECCPISNVVLNLQNTQDLLSIGYKNLDILARHIHDAKSVHILLKIQLVQLKEEHHSLSQDLSRIFAKTNPEYMDTLVECAADPETAPEGHGEEIGADVTQHPGVKSNIRVNSLMIKARSPMLAVMLQPHISESNQYLRFKLDLNELNYSVLLELFRYMYTDKVNLIESNAGKLLPLAAKFCMPGLRALCERALMETITPTNVANILVLADQCKCDTLRQTALHYCENSDAIKENVCIGKNLTWRVMEMVNPDLFLEACESISSSSSAFDSPSMSASTGDEQG